MVTKPVKRWRAYLGGNMVMGAPGTVSETAEDFAKRVWRMCPQTVGARLKVQAIRGKIETTYHEPKAAA